MSLWTRREFLSLLALAASAAGVAEGQEEHVAYLPLVAGGERASGGMTTQRVGGEREHPHTGYYDVSVYDMGRYS